MSRFLTEVNIQQTMVQSDPGVRFREAVSRLEEGQNELKAQIMVIRLLCAEVRLSYEADSVCARMVTMKMNLHELLKELQSFAEWERLHVFPILAELTGKKMGPMSVMDIEREWAEQYLKSYIEETGNTGTSCPEANREELLTRVEQAIFILEEHLRKNEEIVFPLADLIATDMDRYYL